MHTVVDGCCCPAVFVLLVLVAVTVPQSLMALMLVSSCARSLLARRSQSRWSTQGRLVQWHLELRQQHLQQT